MFVRLTFIDIAPENAKKAIEIFRNEVVPKVIEQKGNVEVMLLEPTDPGEQFISITKWETQADADAYEASGLYRTLVDKVKSYFTSKPVLKTYNTEGKVLTM